jgi:hypothetical protein
MFPLLQLIGFWRHPRATVRRWRMTRRWPTPSDFDRMSPREFEDYVQAIGLDARIRAALTEPEPGATQAEIDAGIPVR